MKIIGHLSRLVDITELQEYKSRFGIRLQIQLIPSADFQGKIIACAVATHVLMPGRVENLGAILVQDEKDQKAMIYLKGDDVEILINLVRTRLSVLRRHGKALDIKYLPNDVFSIRGTEINLTIPEQN